MIAIIPTTQHRSDLSMMLSLISTIDFSKSWEDIEYGLGYDLGDYSFGHNDWYGKTTNCAKSIWNELHGFVDDNGNANK